MRIDDPRLAQLITDTVDRRVRAALEMAEQVRYGLVTAVDLANRKATVRIGDATTPSPGFAYAAHTPPAVDDLVRVVIRGADRYVDDDLSAPVERPRIGRSVAANVAQSIPNAAGTRVVHQVATWVDSIATTYSVGSMIIGMAGMYAVTAHVEFASNATGPWRYVGIGRAAGGHATGTGGFGTPSGNTYSVSYPTKQTGAIRHRAAFLVPLAVGDWLSSWVYQDSGAALDIINAELTIVRLGP